MIEVETPDGIVEFPDGTAPDVIERALRQQYSQPSTMDRIGEGVSKVGQVVSDLPQTVSKAWSGEGAQVEFPDAKEISEIQDIGFWESFIPNIKAGLTPDANDKAGSYAKSFKDDPRFGGAFSDQHGNPLLVWNNEPYYVNKPGASMTDATDLVAQTAMMMPAAKYAGGGLSMTSRIARGLPAYAATNTAQQYGSMATGGREEVDLGESGTAGVIGGAAEAVVPPIAKLLGQGAKAAVRPFIPNLADDIARLPKMGAKKNGIPRTKGQRTGDMNLLRREEAMRQGAEGDAASTMLRGFDERQMDAIGAQAQSLESRIGAGVDIENGAKTDIGGTLKSNLINAKKQSKQAVKAAYDTAEKTNATLTVDSAREMADALARVPKEMNIFSTEGMVQLNAVKKKLSNFKLLGKKGKLKPAEIQMIERFRQGLNTSIKGTQGTEQAALLRMKGALDRHMSDAIDQGLLIGDQEAIEVLKNARSLRTLHAKRFEAGKGDRTGNAMLKVLDDNGATPVQTVNYILNTGEAAGQDVALGMVKRLKDVFGADSQQIKLVKSAYLMNMFTKPERGSVAVNKSNMVTNSTKFLEGDGAVIARELFTPEETKAIMEIVQTVKSTITPRDAMNPSRSSWAMLKGLMDRGLISTAGSAGRHLPFVDGIGSGIRNASGAVAASNLISQMPHLTSVPLLSAGMAASANNSQPSLVGYQQ